MVVRFIPLTRYEPRPRSRSSHPFILAQSYTYNKLSNSKSGSCVQAPRCPRIFPCSSCINAQAVRLLCQVAVHTALICAEADTVYRYSRNAEPTALSLTRTLVGASITSTNILAMFSVLQKATDTIKQSLIQVINISKTYTSSYP